MNVYDDLLNLIDEQGSLLILRERLLLLKKELDLQLSMPEEDVANLVGKVDLLERKVAILESQNQKLLKEKESLERNKCYLHERIQSHVDQLEQQRFYRQKLHISTIERSILLYLASYISKTAKEVAVGLGGEQMTTHQHLEYLEKQGLVQLKCCPNKGTIWFLSQPGGRYLRLLVIWCGFDYKDQIHTK